MPEHLRALVVILVLATGVFAIVQAPVCTVASTREDFARRRNLWYGITLTVFLAHNFWIYIIVAASLLLLAGARESNRLAMFYLLLFAVPMFSAEITGLGIIKQLFAIDYCRLLSLTLLLPTYLTLRKQPDTERFGRTLPDKLVAAYLILQFVLMLTANTLTNTLRYGAFYAFLDVFLPYYVASRSLKTLSAFRDAMVSLVVAALVLAAIGAFEFARQWLLYAALGEALGIYWDMGNYLGRGESLRALASTGQPIPLGYVMAVAIGFFLHLRKSVPNQVVWILGLVGLLVGLVVPLSRGPWIGAVAILIIFVATGPSPVKPMLKLGVFASIAAALLLVVPGGKVIIDHLPFFGTVDADNVVYRERLLDVSIQVIMKNPLFGGFEFLYSPAMQELKQGQGIIDVVNTYLGIGLASGLVGIVLYVGFFVSAGAGVVRGMWNVSDKNTESYRLGQVLLSTLIGILIIIFTVASITVIPPIYWSVAGLCVGYARMLRLAKAPMRQPESSKSSGFRAAVPS